MNICIFTRIVEGLLLQSPELVDIKDRNGSSAIHLAMIGLHWDVIEVTYLVLTISITSTIVLLCQVALCEMILFHPGILMDVLFMLHVM